MTVVSKDEIKELSKNMADLYSYHVSVLPTDTDQFRVQVTIRPMFPKEFLDLYGEESTRLRENRISEIVESLRFLVKRGYGFELVYNDVCHELNDNDNFNYISVADENIEIVISSSTFNEFCAKLKDIKERIIIKNNIQSTGSYDITLYPSAEYLNDEIQFCFDSGITFEVIQRALDDFLGCSADSPAQEMYYHILPLTSDIKFVPNGDLKFYEKLVDKSNDIARNLFISEKAPYLKSPLNELFTDYIKEYKRYKQRGGMRGIRTTECKTPNYDKMSSMW
jgi:hypothetical protein